MAQVEQAASVCSMRQGAEQQIGEGELVGTQEGCRANLCHTYQKKVGPCFTSSYAITAGDCLHPTKALPVGGEELGHFD